MTALEMAYKCLRTAPDGMGIHEWARHIEAEIQSAILTEREECAKICNLTAQANFNLGNKDRGQTSEGLAAQIRARSQSAPREVALPRDLPKPGQIVAVKDGKIVFIDPPADWKDLGSGAFEIPVPEPPPIKNKALERDEYGQPDRAYPVDY